ncbi:hypothetical protein I3843_15G074400 [Carya illinoinensis]|uniref:Uncharacterized protein n=1 Tax=Carya illinoinensis TaxID=32201 RepID=A0A8T1NCR2_CARIL|nr:uncharacterized protein LOC122297153 [Carya illinoinensis]KAG2666704.1 hypothetical protein I3760_15G075800 [Carya illinoinensis]KAG6626850.1 hypothetical protein CIPAW_15G080700 [Carya illinoinensis]KAG6675008.1 hypothetical protein I3842_15G077100 [Carya illinoinensis]KAG7943994.1 hypothetical protein I3843_15G074400 [Carya illinoinensis]
MGSLMAGWDSRVQDPESVAYKRNRSFTREEIEAYWSAKKKAEEEHLRDICIPSSDSIQERKFEESVKKFERSKSAPVDNTRQQGFMETEKSLEKLIMKNGWWTRSSWAFLNEPPVFEAASNSYASQFHIASSAASKSNAGDGIVHI